MGIKEKSIEKITSEIKDIIARFASGVNEIDLKFNTYKDRVFFTFSTNEIPMTPCVFKSLQIVGEGHECLYGDEVEAFWISMRWDWSYFGGGRNGAELLNAWISKPNEYKPQILEIKLR